MAAPLGNDNNRKNKPWADSINRALARYGDGKLNALNVIADQLVTAAVNGDKWAIEEIGNRVDGKPKQQVENTGLNGGPMEMMLIEATQAKRMAQEYAAE